MFYAILYVSHLRLELFIRGLRVRESLFIEVLLMYFDILQVLIRNSYRWLLEPYGIIQIFI